MVEKTAGEIVKEARELQEKYGGDINVIQKGLALEQIQERKDTSSSRTSRPKGFAYTGIESTTERVARKKAEQQATLRKASAINELQAQGIRFERGKAASGQKFTPQQEKILRKYGLKESEAERYKGLIKERKAETERQSRLKTEAETERKAYYQEETPEQTTLALSLAEQEVQASSLFGGLRARRLAEAKKKVQEPKETTFNFGGNMFSVTGKAYPFDYREDLYKDTLIPKKEAEELKSPIYQQFKTIGETNIERGKEVLKSPQAKKIKTSAATSFKVLGLPKEIYEGTISSIRGSSSTFGKRALFSSEYSADTLSKGLRKATSILPKRETTEKYIIKPFVETITFPSSKGVNWIDKAYGTEFKPKLERSKEFAIKTLGSVYSEFKTKPVKYVKLYSTSYLGGSVLGSISKTSKGTKTLTDVGLIGTAAIATPLIATEIITTDKNKSDLLGQRIAETGTIIAGFEGGFRRKPGTRIKTKRKTTASYEEVGLIPRTEEPFTSIDLVRGGKTEFPKFKEQPFLKIGKTEKLNFYELTPKQKATAIKKTSSELKKFDKLELKQFIEQEDIGIGITEIEQPLRLGQTKPSFIKERNLFKEDIPKIAEEFLKTKPIFRRTKTPLKEVQLQFKPFSEKKSLFQIEKIKQYRDIGGGIILPKEQKLLSEIKGSGNEFYNLQRIQSKLKTGFVSERKPTTQKELPQYIFTESEFAKYLKKKKSKLYSSDVFSTSISLGSEFAKVFIVPKAKLLGSEIKTSFKATLKSFKPTLIIGGSKLGYKDRDRLTGVIKPTYITDIGIRDGDKDRDRYKNRMRDFIIPETNIRTSQSQKQRQRQKQKQEFKTLLKPTYNFSSNIKIDLQKTQPKKPKPEKTKIKIPSFKKSEDYFIKQTKRKKKPKKSKRLFRYTASIIGGQLGIKGKKRIAGGIGIRPLNIKF